MGSCAPGCALRVAGFAAALTLLQACGAPTPREAEAPAPAAAAEESAAEAPAEPRLAEVAGGVVVTPAAGPARKVRLLAMEGGGVRVTATPTDDLDLPESLMVIAGTLGPDDYEVVSDGDAVSLSTAALTATVSIATGEVSFRNAAGDLILQEDGRGTFTPTTVDGEPFYAIHQAFNHGTDEGFYGLGQHQNGQFNYNGEDVELAQHNLVIAVPFVVSSRNYGVLWDNNAITRFGDPRPYQPIGESLIVRDAEGAPGGLTARYFAGDEALVTRVEADPDHQYLPADQFLHEGAPRGNWPEAFGETSPDRVVWEGSLEAATTGVHKFRLYASSYVELYIDGELVVERWRQNWNPWYNNFDLPMTAGEPRSIRIEWRPNGGYLRLLHLDPPPEGDRRQLSLSSDLAHAIDYYVVAGDDMDDVIAGYRRLTGPAVMLPKWAYGFWQSRQRYTTQEELLDVLRTYRRMEIPIDNIVLDWFYWEEDSWGSHEFDATRFPDPQAMVDEVHALDAQIMISVWPKFYPTTENFAELDAGGHIYRRQLEMQTRDWVGPGYQSTFYDPYSEEARRIYWRQIYENLGVLGFDAWWMDATEPDMHSNLSYEERSLRMGPTALGPGAAFFNSYALKNAQAVFEGLQQADPDDRVFILTRSGFGGLQRYGAATWSGDIVARWDDLRDQISAGVNMSMTGLPNWTFDIGGFAVEDRYTNEDPEHIDEWRELNARWFQFGAFAPIFRSHGEYPYREIFNIAPEGSDVFESLVWYDELRYRLMPYIYTVAADTYHKDGTIMRGLVMDFPEDPNVAGLGEQYMFGPAFLVSPVYERGARTWSVYLPAGARWRDFYTGALLEGGRTVEADAPLSRMPLFVRAGAIVPTGPAVQHTFEDTGGALTLLVYPGADGAFELYEDDGESDAYEDGAWSRIPMRYDDETGVLTLGDRIGGFPGMPGSRTIGVRWMDGPLDLDAPADATVTYDGRAITIARE